VKPGKIRPLAICIFRRGDRIFAAEGYDEVKGQTFYRPLGGKIEFGEHSAQTIVRELREEIGAEATALRYLGTLENIFTYNGQPGHEIVLVYDGAFVDPAMYKVDALEGREDDGDLLFIARWMPLDAFRGDDAPPLYPDGLLDLIDQS
jgi:8-oxo-dGTP pyrophosphatase MutT (NUDIX family)